MAKSSRFTLGQRIDERFLDLIEFSYTAYFTAEENKEEKIEGCIFILDKLKYLVSLAWEGRLISNRHFEELAGKLEEAGKMLGGWKRSFNNPYKKNRIL
jgi:hypothetical protein